MDPVTVICYILIIILANNRSKLILVQLASGFNNRGFHCGIWCSTFKEKTNVKKESLTLICMMFVHSWAVANGWLMLWFN